MLAVSSFYYQSFIRTQEKTTGIVFEYLSSNSLQALSNRGVNMTVFESLGVELDKYQVFMYLNTQFTNVKISHFEVSEIKNEDNVDSAKIRQIVWNVDPSLISDDRLMRVMNLNKTTVSFGNVECKNKRENSKEAEKAPSLSNFTENDRIYLYFQMTYIKLMFQNWNYNLKRDSFPKAVCIHELDTPITFVYYIDNLKYTFSCRFYISISLLYTVKGVDQVRQTQNITRVIPTRALVSQSTENLITQLKARFLSQSTDVKMLLYEIAAQHIECQIYTEYNPTDADAVFSNFPLSNIQTYVAKNQEYSKKITQFADEYKLMFNLKNNPECEQNTPLCTANTNYIKEKNKNTILQNEKKKIETQIQTTEKFLNLILEKKSLLKANKTVFQHNCYTNIFLD